MNELVILSFDNEADAEQARKALAQAASDSVVVLPDLATAIARVAEQRARPAGLRRWALLPWQVGVKALGGALTAVTWTSLIIGVATGELAGRLLGHDEQDGLRQQVTQAVQPDKAPVILLTRGKTSAKLLDGITRSSERVYRTRISANAAARIQSAFGSG